MTREQRKRVAREILGWTDPDDTIMCANAHWLWPLETALMERGWMFKLHENGRYETLKGLADASRDTHAEVVNAAALIEIGEEK